MLNPIFDFFRDVDPKIYDRSIDYYHSGMICALTRSGRVYQAEVSGSGTRPYRVDVRLSSDGDVEDYACTCPYDLGEVCKHIVAVMLAIDEGEFLTEASAETKAEKSALALLLEKAPKEQLSLLIQSQAENNPAFYSEVLSVLGAPAKDEYDAAKSQIKESIRRNTHRGYIDYQSCDIICADMDGVLNNAQRRFDRGQLLAALELTEYILLTGVKLASTADSSSGSLEMTVKHALEMIDSCATELGSGSTEDRHKVLETLLKLAKKKVFDGWEHWRYEVLQSAARLTDKKSAAKLYKLLDSYVTARAEDDFSSFYLNSDKAVRHGIILSVEGKKAARRYIDENLDVDELRELAVLEDIKVGNWENAERLCLDRIQGDNLHWRIAKWDGLLREIYERSDQRDKLIAWTRRMLLLGDMESYGRLKKLLEKIWEDEYPALLRDIANARPSYEYMRILALEKETALLMEQVKKAPETVFDYGGMLSQDYPYEIFTLCKTIIRKEAEYASDRRAYRGLCGRIKTLFNFGGAIPAKEILDELRLAYMRRPALLDELRLLEGKLFK